MTPRRERGDARAGTSRWRDGRAKRDVARVLVARTLRSSGARRRGTRGGAGWPRSVSRCPRRARCTRWARCTRCRALASRWRGLFDNARSRGRRGRASPLMIYVRPGQSYSVSRRRCVADGVLRGKRPGQLFSVARRRCVVGGRAEEREDLASCSPFRGAVARSTRSRALNRTWPAVLRCAAWSRIARRTRRTRGLGQPFSVSRSDRAMSLTDAARRGASLGLSCSTADGAIPEGVPEHPAGGMGARSATLRASSLPAP